MRCRQVRKRISAYVSGTHPEGRGTGTHSKLWGTKDDGSHPKGWGTPDGTHPKGWGALSEREREAISAHLEQCAECARLVEVERSLSNDIEHLRQVQTVRPLAIEQVRDGIAVRENRRHKTGLGERIMREINDTINRRPRLSIAVIAVAGVLLASVVVPVGTERSVGYEVAFAAPVPDLAVNPQNAERLLAGLDIKQARVKVAPSDSGVEYRITPLTDSTKVRRLMAVLDSLGGRRVRSDSTSPGLKRRTIWNFLIDAIGSESSKAGDTNVVLNLKDIFPGDALLWMPVGEQPADSMVGLLLNRQGNKTNIHIIGGKTHMEPDDCGWHQYLNNAVMHTQRPDGVEDTFNLYDVNDVRRLEKLGYNFATMKWQKPGKFPIPGMGPKLNYVKGDPSSKSVDIEFMVPQAYKVSLEVLAEDGHTVRTLRDCIMLAGITQLVWDGTDESGEAVARGKYICRFTAGDYVQDEAFTLGG